MLYSYCRKHGSFWIPIAVESIGTYQYVNNLDPFFFLLQNYGAIFSYCSYPFEKKNIQSKVE
jgi:hypothetical protein